MRVLFDTSIILDVLLNRQPWVQDSSALWRANGNGEIVGYVTVHVQLDEIVTRDPSGFKASSIAVYDVAQMLQQF